jgi:xanthine dehydrogenase large subunit
VKCPDLDASAVRVQGELSIGGQEHFYLETQSAIAWIDESGCVSVESSTQHPAETQESCRASSACRGTRSRSSASAWAAPSAERKCRPTRTQRSPRSAHADGRPVRVRLPRHLDMVLTGKRHPYFERYDTGFAADGRIEGLRLELYSDGGWSLDLSEPIMWRSLFHCDNAYYLPAVEATGWVCRTHKTSQTAFRGFGGPQAMLVIEEVMAQAAQRLGLAVETIRERNFYRDGQSTHYGQTVDDASRIARVWGTGPGGECVRRATRRGRRLQRRASARETWLAVTPVKFGISFTATFYNQGGALVLIYRDGSVQVNQGGTEMGQGLFTKIPAHCRRHAGAAAGRHSRDADAHRQGAEYVCDGGIGGNRFERRGGGQRLRAVAGPASAVAAAYWHASRLRSASRTASCPAATARSHSPTCARPPISSGCRCSRRGSTGRPTSTSIRSPVVVVRFYYFACGAAVSEVEVDGFTGDYRLRPDRHRPGRRRFGGGRDRSRAGRRRFHSGHGMADDRRVAVGRAGALASAGASTYKLPSWSEVPGTFNVTFLPRATQAGVVFGSKAVGEPPLMLAISVREALRDAVLAFAGVSPGDRVDAPITFDSPATPERIFFAVQRARARRALTRHTNRRVTLANLNALGRDAFVDAVGWVFEDSPWIAERVWPGRPFASLEGLAPDDDRGDVRGERRPQLVLLRAHPDLGAKLKMSAASTGEQAASAWIGCRPDVYTQLSELNAEYRQKFGFPFLFAVKDSTPAQILEALQSRLPRERAIEFEEALRQVARIAWFRLEGIFTR